MKEIDDHILLLRYMASILMERKSSFRLTEYQREKCEKGVQALDKAIEALQTQVYA